jgi:hypothetical protein
MFETCTVVAVVSPSLIVVEHKQGFTVVELVGAHRGIEAGDQVGTLQVSLGEGDLFKMGTRYDAFFHRSWSRLEEAIDAAGHMASF